MKKRNHYVWKHYLKPWLNCDGKIIYKRDGKIDDINLNNIAVEKYFYKLQQLSSDDLKFIEKVFLNEKNPHVFEIDKEWFALFSWANSLISLKDRINNEDIQKDLDILIKEFNENIHTKIESLSENYLECLYKKDISFYDTEEGNTEFNFFICEQYFRTSDMKKRMIQMHIPVKNVNFENCWNVASHILAINLSLTLSANRDKFKCILLENETDISFLTSDQPVVNIAGNRRAMRKLTMNEFEIYYPVTPKIAFLLCFKENLLGSKKSVITLDDSQVKNYNSMVKNQGGSIIFSNSRDGL
jgi:hypothetical protein